ncbi:MAG: hypothetical protein AAFX93_15415 [Verrucomicrobiota bacterium]
MSALASHAALVVNFDQVGPDVVVSTFGSIDLTGAPIPTPFNLSGAGVQAAAGDLVVSGSVFGESYFGFFTVVPGPLGPFGLTFASGEGGDALAILSSSNELVLPTGYVSNTNINASSVYFGHTFATIGLTPGTYVGTLTNGDTATINIGVVPEPSTYIAFGGFVGLSAFVCYRRGLSKSAAS